MNFLFLEYRGYLFAGLNCLTGCDEVLRFFFAYAMIKTGDDLHEVR